MKKVNIAPGEELVLDVDYHAGNNASDDQRAIDVTFDESEQNKRFLLVANIRPEVFLDQSDLRFGVVANGQPVQRSLRMENYSAKPWEAITVRTEAPWLSVRCEREIASQEIIDGPLESWRCRVDLNTVDLAPGEHTAAVALTPRGSSGQLARQYVSCRLVCASPIALVPREFFFKRSVDRAAQVERIKLLWKLSTPFDGEIWRPQIDHRPGEVVRVSLQHTETDEWFLVAELGSDAPTELHSEVTLRLGCDWITLIQVPITVVALDGA